MRSSGASSTSVAAISVPPNPSTAAQRRMEAMASRASTGVPSWKRRPGRRVSVHSRPSILHHVPGQHLRLGGVAGVEAV